MLSCFFVGKYSWNSASNLKKGEGRASPGSPSFLLVPSPQEFVSHWMRRGRGRGGGGFWLKDDLTKEEEEESRISLSFLLSQTLLRWKKHPWLFTSNVRRRRFRCWQCWNATVGEKKNHVSSICASFIAWVKSVLDAVSNICHIGKVQVTSCNVFF